MLKIINQVRKVYLTFSELELGDIFEFEDNYYIKIFHASDGANSFCLSKNTHANINLAQTIVRKQAELAIHD